MKRLIVLITLLLILSSGYAKKFKGYVITLNNDTIYLLIKVPGLISYGFDGKLEEVDTVDSLGNSKTYDYDAIKEFGYTKDSAVYMYKFKPIKDSMKYFLEEIIGGPKTNLYKYDLVSTHTVEEFYTFEKPSGALLFLKNYDRLETFQEKLISFYSDTPGIEQFVSERFKGRGRIQRDISEVLNKVNGTSTVDYFKNAATGLF